MMLFVKFGWKLFFKNFQGCPAHARRVAVAAQPRAMNSTFIHLDRFGSLFDPFLICDSVQVPRKETKRPPRPRKRSFLTRKRGSEDSSQSASRSDSDDTADNFSDARDDDDDDDNDASEIEFPASSRPKASRPRKRSRPSRASASSSSRSQQMGSRPKRRKLMESEDAPSADLSVNDRSRSPPLGRLSRLSRGRRQKTTDQKSDSDSDSSDDGEPSEDGKHDKKKSAKSNGRRSTSSQRNSKLTPKSGGKSKKKVSQEDSDSGVEDLAKKDRLNKRSGSIKSAGTDLQLTDIIMIDPEDGTHRYPLRQRSLTPGSLSEKASRKASNDVCVPIEIASSNLALMALLFDKQERIGWIE